MNNKNIIVYDYETDGKDAEVCSPVQLAACAVHPKKLTIIEGSLFKSYMRPPNIDSPDYLTPKIQETVEWHAKKLKCTIEQVLKLWKDAPPQEQVWKAYVKYVERYNLTPSKPSEFNAPVRCGYNILNFDDVITERLMKQYGTKVLYNKVYKLDVMDIMFSWFENSNDLPKLGFDVVREYVGLSSEGAHTADKDVEDTAKMLIKFLTMHRNIYPKVKFKDSFK